MRPAFLIKMLRTRAASLYGWDILLRGTVWPGPVIGKRCAEQIYETASAGHEAGLHAWDHHKWQMRIEHMDQTGVYREVKKGFDLLKSIIGRNPESFAAPAWKITPDALYALDQFPFRFESDCRGHSLFVPTLNGRKLSHVQIPATLPTYDELIGRECTPDTYNSYILNLIKPDVLNILTIHAEAEGIGCLPLFEDFLTRAKQEGIMFVPLGDLLSDSYSECTSTIKQGEVTGRDGWVSCQSNTSPGA
jgi:undecaprenyl phosphate-alpha-L-ara4FN deformylase